MSRRQVSKMRSIVHLPITGYVEVEVIHEEGLLEKEIISAALRTDVEAKDIQEWETHRNVTQGNVCHALMRDAEVVETEPCEGDEDDEEKSESEDGEDGDS